MRINNEAMTKYKEVAIRLYSSDGERSTMAHCHQATTCRQLCQKFSCDFITLQVGNFHFRQLGDEENPMQILVDFAKSVSLSTDLEEFFRASRSPSFRHLLAFFLGRVRLRAKSSLLNEILVEDGEIRRGKLVKSWTTANVIFFNFTVRVQNPNGEDEVYDVREMKADTTDTKRGKCLRLRNSETCILVKFQRAHVLPLWLSRAQQAENSTKLDLSDECLTLVPEQYFKNSSRILSLNLRRNSLTCRPTSNKVIPIGFIEDISRMHNLKVLDLSSNRINTFPVQLTTLMNLETVNLSFNFIRAVPADVQNMRRLSSLDLTNNLLRDLPSSLSNCEGLVELNLAFNLFSAMPACLPRLQSLRSLRFSGNDIEELDEELLGSATWLELRRNALPSSFRLNVEHITHVDIRDNANVSTVHLTALNCLQVVHCERLQLTNLYVNGTKLTHLHADHNLLDNIIVMPLPENLHTLSVSHNQLRSLPDWIADLPHFTLLRVNNNLLTHLPHRIFCSRSLRSICAYSNQLESLSEEIGENCLESLIIYRNKLRSLPKAIFRRCYRLRQLNASSNKLELLPFLDSANASSNRIQILRLSDNDLTESCVPTIVNMKQLKVLDLSSNRLNSFDDSALASLDCLEELSVCSNKLKHISDVIPSLGALQTFRAHSNNLTHMPDFSRSGALKILDLSSNQLSLSSLQFTPPPSLRFLDLTCNSGVFVSEKMSESTPISVKVVNRGEKQINGFHIGCAETSGAKNKQCVRHLVAGKVCGIVDGGSNYQISASILRFLYNYFNEKEECDLLEVLLRCHYELGEDGERLSAGLLLMRIDQKVLEVVSSGTITMAVIKNNSMIKIIDGKYDIDDEEYDRIRGTHAIIDEENRINGIASTSRQLGHFSMHPTISPNPVCKKIPVDDSLEAVVIANSPLWNSLTGEEIRNMATSNTNTIVSAKKLQDKLQSFDYGGNSSIIVVRPFKPPKSFTSPEASATSSIPTIVSESNDDDEDNDDSLPPPPLPATKPPYVPVENSSLRGPRFRNHFVPPQLSDDKDESEKRFEERRRLISTSLCLTPPTSGLFQI